MNVIERIKANFKLSHWSGGKTKEIFLSPVNGNYRPGEFDFRVSTASICLNQTEFTQLPNYKRLIMSIDKPIKLQHTKFDSTKTYQLAPLEVHAFSGDVKTTSFGTCTDFNLIFKKDLFGDMVVVFANKTMNLAAEYYIVYALENLKFNLYHHQNFLSKYKVQKNDSIIFKCPENEYSIEFEPMLLSEPIAIICMISKSDND